MHKKQILIVSVIVLGLAAGSAFGASTMLWTGGGGADNRWSNPANWTNGVPAVGDLATLGNSAPNTPQVINLDVNVSLDRLSCTATGSRDYTINTTNGSKITLMGGHDFYCVNRTAKLTVNCDVDTGSSVDLQVDRYGLTIFNGSCGPEDLAAQDSGELVLTASNSFRYVYMYGGEIFAKHPKALGASYFRYSDVNGTLSLSTNMTIPTLLYTTFPGVIRLRDSGAADVTLTIGDRCLGDRATVGPSVGTSTGHLTIRLLARSSHETEWSLATNSTLVFANDSLTATWGTSAAVGTVSGPGDVRIESGSEVVMNCTNNYTGGTVIKYGLLRLNGNNRLPVAGDLSLPATNATFYLASFTQTVARLSGIGTIQLSYSASSAAGKMQVGAAFLPGNEDMPGAMTVNRKGSFALAPGCTSRFRLGAPGGTNDAVVLQHNVTHLSLAGTLCIEKLPRLASGDYKLFDLNGGSIAGAFSQVVMPPYFSGEIDTSSGDVVLKVKGPPAGTLLLVN